MSKESEEFIYIVNGCIDKIKSQVKSRGFRAANEVTNAAKTVLGGERSGKVYKIRGGGTYRASKAGEPPAIRTGAFRGSFKRISYTESTNNGIKVHAIAESALKVNKYLLGEILENGTRKMQPRP